MLCCRDMLHCLGVSAGSRGPDDSGTWVPPGSDQGSTVFERTNLAESEEKLRCVLSYMFTSPSNTMSGQQNPNCAC